MSKRELYTELREGRGGGERESGRDFFRGRGRLGREWEKESYTVRAIYSW